MFSVAASKCGELAILVGIYGARATVIEFSARETDEIRNRSSVTGDKEAGFATVTSRGNDLVALLSVSSGDSTPPNSVLATRNSCA